jgi:hypothetical protein
MARLPFENAQRVLYQPYSPLHIAHRSLKVQVLAVLVPAGVLCPSYLMKHHTQMQHK